MLDLDHIFKQQAQLLLEQAPWNRVIEAVHTINASYPGLLDLGIENIDFRNGTLALLIKRNDTGAWLKLKSEMGYSPNLRQTPSMNTPFVMKDDMEYWGSTAKKPILTFSPAKPFDLILEELLSDKADEFETTIRPARPSGHQSHYTPAQA